MRCENYSKKRRAGIRGNSGFTLVEILVVLALTGLVTMSIYKAMGAQQKVYSVQEQAVEMQENLRASMDLIVQDLRHAGLDPLGTAGAGFVTAAAGTVQFTMDISGGPVDPLADFPDGDTTDTDENLTFTLAANGDFQRNGVPITQNIQAVEFFYTLANGTRILAPANLSEIRLVQVTILARNALQDKDFQNNNVTYTLPSGTVLGPYNDKFRRRMLTTVVRCRNMGFLK